MTHTLPVLRLSSRTVSPPFGGFLRLVRDDKQAVDSVFVILRRYTTLHCVTLDDSNDSFYAYFLLAY